MLALQFNCNRGEKTKAAEVTDFHPFREAKKRRGMTREQVRSMRPMIEAIARSMK
ncbi:hypothetical protein [Allorhodopirellula heiligendammensis]|uniref:Uncharacterized protein n=1 Tax=Allorhodopirellula heiligendammensis TaxID=2714739 RepID=A0A5C6C1W7_9BACT|nr:hypothetical protein [Allorhodopirellula heiligendammensis]TWU17987.1 hypothetical protein Poly21_01400 [Allorhodopirellula heiligendammensis]